MLRGGGNHPQDHGDRPHLPAVMVEDTAKSPGRDVIPIDVEENAGAERGKIIAHTARPPVELMGDE